MLRLGKLVKRIPNDITIICADGEVQAIRIFTIAAAPCWAVENGSITLMEDNVRDLQNFVNWNQYDESPADLEDLCHLLIFLNKYKIEYEETLDDFGPYCYWAIENALLMCNLLRTPLYKDLHKYAGDVVHNYLYSKRCFFCPKCKKHTAKECDKCCVTDVDKPCIYGHSIGDICNECFVCKSPRYVVESPKLLKNVDLEVIGIMLKARSATM